MKVITANKAAEIAAETRARLISAAIEEIKGLKTKDAALYDALEKVFARVSELSSSRGSVAAEFNIAALFVAPYRIAHIDSMLLLLRLLGYDAAFSPKDISCVVVSWHK